MSTAAPPPPPPTGEQQSHEQPGDAAPAHPHATLSPEQMAELYVGAGELLGRAWIVVTRNIGAVYGYGTVLMILFVILFSITAELVYSDLVEQVNEFSTLALMQTIMTGEISPEIAEFLFEVTLRTAVFALFATLCAAVFAAGVGAYFLQRGRGLPADFGTLFQGFRAFVPLVIGALILYAVFVWPIFAVQAMAFADGAARIEDQGLAVLFLVLLVWAFVGMALFSTWTVATLDQRYSAADSLRRWWRISALFRMRLIVAYLLLSLVAVGAVSALILLGSMVAQGSPDLALLVLVVGFLLVFLPILAMSIAVAAATYDALHRFHRYLRTGLVHPGLYPDPTDTTGYGHGYPANPNQRQQPSS